MTVVVLSLAPHVEDRLLPQLLDEGHVIAARPAGAVEAAAALDRIDADALLVSAAARHCDAALQFPVSDIMRGRREFDEGDHRNLNRRVVARRSPFVAQGNVSDPRDGRTGPVAAKS